LLAPLMWPVIIDVGLVAGQHRAEVSVTPDERQVQTLAAKTAHEPLRVTIARGARTGVLIVRAPPRGTAPELRDEDARAVVADAASVAETTDDQQVDGHRICSGSGSPCDARF